MKAIDHQTARRLVHARLDGAVDGAASARLDAHLQDCAACRRYAAETADLHAGLRRAFRDRPSTPATLPAPATQAIYNRVATSRAKMKRSFPFHLSEAATFVILLLLLAGGLSLALANPQLRSSLAPLARQQGTPTTAATSTPLPSPTPTPFPWTAAAPATTPAEIVPVLQKMAQKNIQFWLQPGWVYSQTSDVGKPGSIAMYFNETWTHYSSQPGACPEMLAIIKERPDSEDAVQIQVSLTDGSYGDLLALRDGEGQIQKSTQECPPQPALTTAGILARRMSGDKTVPIKGSLDESLETVRAWYETLDGSTILFVEAAFDTPAGMTPKTVETYWFSLDNGLDVQRGLRMERENGELTGATLTATQYTFYPELPPAAADQVTAALAELRSLAANPVVLPTATPLPAGAVDALRGLAYNREAPLEDGQKILAALGALRQEQLEFLSKPGWYLYGRAIPIEGEIENRYQLFHVLDGGKCELLTYYYQLPDGRVATNEITLADGPTGRGDIIDAVIEDIDPVAAPCSPNMLDSVTLLSNEIDELQDAIAGKTGGANTAWVETIQGRPVFVLYSDTTYQAPRPNTMDPDTRKFEAMDRSQQWECFDLQTGVTLGSFYQITLENGKTFGAPFDPAAPLPYELKYLSAPPDNVLQAFDKAVQELLALIEK